jgi:hypothetical protein
MAAPTPMRAIIHPTTLSGRIALFVNDRRTPDHPLLRVLKFMDTRYSETTPLGLPAWYVAEQVGCKERDVWKHWSTLTALGYIVEHPRPTQNDPRQFTLCPLHTEGLWADAATPTRTTP